MARLLTRTDRFHEWSVRVRLNSSLNKALQFIAYPFRPSPSIPDLIWKRLPIVGTFPIEIYPGKYFYYASSGEPTGKLLYWKGIWEFEAGTTVLFFALAKSARLIIDIGAHTGLYTLLAKAANPSIWAVAFEPVPFIYEKLLFHLTLNQIEQNIQTEQAIIADVSQETVPFFVPTHPWATSSSLISNFKTSPKDAILVKSYTLDDYVKEQDLKDIDLIKIDVEGAERQVLQGARNTLSVHRPIIFCEILPQDEANLRQLEQIINELDYQFALVTRQEFQLQPQVIPDKTRSNKNFLLWPREKSRKLEFLLNKK